MTAILDVRRYPEVRELQVRRSSRSGAGRYFGWATVRR
jgi:hypothetical protein